MHGSRTISKMFTRCFSFHLNGTQRELTPYGTLTMVGTTMFKDSSLYIFLFNEQLQVSVVIC